MNKYSSPKIERFYKDKNVVSEYERKRFYGRGGRYIDAVETGSILLILKSFFGKENGKRLLEIGAGKGRLTKRLVKRGFFVYAIDASEKMARELMAILPPKQVIVKSIFDSFDFPSGFFDGIVSLRFFDHFAIEKDKQILKKTLPFVHKNGCVVFSCLNSWSLERLLSIFFYFGKTNYYYSDKEYKNLFTKMGLRVVKRNSYFFLPRGVFLFFADSKPVLNLLMLFERVLAKCFPNFCSFFVYLLEKT